MSESKTLPNTIGSSLFGITIIFIFDAFVRFPTHSKSNEGMETESGPRWHKIMLSNKTGN